MKRVSNFTTWIIILLVLLFAVFAFIDTGSSVQSITYDVFISQWETGNISEITIQQDNTMASVTGELASGEKFQTMVSSGVLDNFISENQEGSNISLVYQEVPGIPIWITYLPTFLLIFMLIAFWFMFLQQSQGGGSGKGVMNFGKNKAKVASVDEVKVNFNDVAGAEEEKEELEEVVDFLKRPKKYIEMGARIPKGVLLMGPPGTGKTLLAKAVAGEAGVPFFSISGSDFVEMFVGVGASRVRDLFQQAKKNSPCIVFIDEIDAVGRQRGAGLGGGNDEREQTLNQLLVEMDGFAVNEGIIIIAATNRPDILDKALMRPGRFDRQILVTAPDVKGREEILKVHARNKRLGDDVDLGVVSKRTPGFTGADLENLMNEAALMAVRAHRQIIAMEDMEEAATRVMAGPEKKSRVMNEKDRNITAYHEAGHAVVMRFLENTDPVHQISIIPRGMAGGYTMSLPEEDVSYMSKSKMLDEMVGLIGGRVAEQLIIGDISTGAKNDIDRLSSIARKMVMSYGMSKEIGTISYGTAGNEEVFLGRDIGREKNYSEEVAAIIDKEIKQLCDDAYAKAEAILNEHIDKLHDVAQALLKEEKLEAYQFNAIIDGKTLEEAEADREHSRSLFGAKDIKEDEVQITESENDDVKMISEEGVSEEKVSEEINEEVPKVNEDDDKVED